MNIPGRVKIGPHRYDVVLKKKKFESSDGQGWAVGNIDYAKGRIRVRIDQPHYMFSTFIHECVHGMDYVADIGLSETEVHRLANVLAAFLIDNGYVKEPS